MDGSHMLRLDVCLFGDTVPEDSFREHFDIISLKLLSGILNSIAWVLIISDEAKGKFNFNVSFSVDSNTARSSWNVVRTKKKIENVEIFISRKKFSFGPKRILSDSFGCSHESHIYHTSDTIITTGESRDLIIRLKSHRITRMNNY